MSAVTTNNYKATFILDLRESEDDAAKVLADIKDVFGDIGAEVSESEDLGIRDFSRAADQRYKQGHYLEFYFSGPGSVPATLKEKLRLDKRVNRIFVESL
ncbi:30S ribosomal protein S6 [Coraliomargarita sinensis]|uniref:Small ribosomal subunit protein bS6 n=1 Tax=Coraliomargarita sinensis TaxID=2174842 RepID=A0A317ZGH9_9BACT|nr:30S ribosomal protein S6 [Coraliomargarita sinensis]PXA04715.1 30S ribosomal protein S6 [Coraliomargarita sinensis]